MGNSKKLKVFTWPNNSGYSPTQKIIQRNEREKFMAYVNNLKSNFKRIVLTNGCFNILKKEHINYLNTAKEMGDILIVAINTDKSIQSLKGPEYRLNKLKDRVNNLAKLKCVDFIIPFTEHRATSLVKLIKPHIYTKGGDYTISQLIEGKVASKLGAKVILIPYIDDYSTTNIIDKIKNQLEQKSPYHEKAFSSDSNK